MRFAAELREELAHVAVPATCCRRAETSALLRFGGAMRLGGGGIGWVAETASGGVARRLRAQLDELCGVRPEIEVHQPGNLRRATRYRLVLVPPAERVLRELGILDARARPVERVPVRLVRRSCDAAAYLRGAVMAAGSVSDPRAGSHLELRAPGEGPALALAELVARVAGHAPGVGEHGDGHRVTLKAGPAIGTLLARLGAHAAFLRWDAERLHRELRGDANRAANAESANLQRSVTAASRQVRAAAALLASPIWDDLPEDLRAVTLARLANPEASLTELGGLLDPPVGKSAVYRRLARVVGLAASEHV